VLSAGAELATTPAHDSAANASSPRPPRLRVRCMRTSRAGLRWTACTPAPSRTAATLPAIELNCVYDAS